MADTAEQPGESLDRLETPVVPPMLRGDSAFASGILETSPSPSLVPGGVGTQVLSTRVEMFEASPYTDFIQNPIHATILELSL